MFPPLPIRNDVFACGISPKTGSDPQSEILHQSRTWVFRVRLLSFCKVEHTIALQKVASPSLWALHASPSNHRPASFLFISLRPAAQGLACQHSVDMKTTLLKTSGYVNRVATKTGLQQVFPTCWAPMYHYIIYYNIMYYKVIYIYIYIYTHIHTHTHTYTYY